MPQDGSEFKVTMLAFAVLYLNIVWQDEALCIPCKEQRLLWLRLQACAQHQLVISKLVQPDKDLSNLHCQVRLAIRLMARHCKGRVVLTFKLLRKDCTTGRCA